MNPRSSLHQSLRLAFLILLSAGLTGRAQAPSGPGPEHEALKRLAGEWTATVKSPEGDTPGTMTAVMQCGGLWLVTEFKSSFGGVDFHGRGLDGYDPVSKKHVSVWVDSMSTKPLFFEGTLDKATKTLTMVADGIGMDGKPAKFKSLTHYPDADHYTFTLFQVGGDGQDQKMMTIEYTRKKG
jgi:hypothetical protein